MSIRIVVDSTADIPPDRAEQLGIAVIPETVLFGDEAFLDGIDLDGPAFYRKLAASRVMPTTSAPAPSLIEKTYHEVIAAGATGILSMHIASAFSATISAAQSAAEVASRETGVPIELVDSGTVSAGFGLPAELVAQEARQGKTLAELKAHAESLCQRTRVFAVLDTLTYLQRGGRIGRAQALMGTLLNVKPLVGVRDGQVVPIENVRTRSQAYARLGQLVEQLGALEAVAIVQSDPDAGTQLAAVIHQSWLGPIEVFTLGPVVGTHAGPGAAGVAVITRAS
jgi:DegV family protein with EDD domain